MNPTDIQREIDRLEQLLRSGDGAGVDTEAAQIVAAHGLTYGVRLSPRELVRIRWWDLSVYLRLVQGTEEHAHSVFGWNLSVLPGVHGGFWPDTRALAHTIQVLVQPGDRVLDFGTGTGIQGMAAVTRGATVTAIDFNWRALDCARINFAQNGVEGIELFYSDGFSGLKGRRFNVIAANLPFRPFKPVDLVDAASNDHDYAFLNQFLDEAPDHLENDGRILLVFSTTCDIAYIRETFTRHGYQWREVITINPDGDWNIYSTFELRTTK